MKRGSVIVASQRGDFSGKPRPWLVVQCDLFLDQPISITACMISTTHDATEFRVPIAPSPANGLTEKSVILADRITSIRGQGLREVCGEVGEAVLRQVDDALRLWLDL
jgi:mRNA interferase MazF